MTPDKPSKSAAIRMILPFFLGSGISCPPHKLIGQGFVRKEIGIKNGSCSHATGSGLRAGPGKLEPLSSTNLSIIHPKIMYTCTQIKRNTSNTLRIRSTHHQLSINEKRSTIIGF